MAAGGGQGSAPQLRVRGTPVLGRPRRPYLAEVERLLLLEVWPRPLLPVGDGSHRLIAPKYPALVLNYRFQ